LPVAVGTAPGAQVIVSGICQFNALEDPEDRPPSVLSTMLSGIRPAGAGLATLGLVKAGLATSGLATAGPVILGAR
jgi:hypothetical protein